MRMENGTGTVSKLSGKRRKPYCAKMFVGWRTDDAKKRTVPVYKSIGCFAKKSEAYRALMDAKVKPVERSDKITLERVYSEWSERHFEKLADGSRHQYINAWSYLAVLHGRDIRDLRTADYEDAIEKANPPRTARANAKVLLSMMYKYALAHEYCEKDYSQLVDFKGDKSARIVRKVFTPKEVETLFTRGDVTSDAILVGIYTGMRPNELLSLRVDEVDLETGFLRIRGSKTESGHNRAIPIHPKILPILTRRREESAKLKATAVFLRDGKHPLAYRYYSYQVVDHTPHDTRHSFVTYAHKSGMDALAVKMIVGHSTSGDVTQSVYTHLDEEFLQREMEKFTVA